MNEDIQTRITTNVVEDKYYVSPGSVYVGSRGIFVDFDGTFVQINHLAHDDQGIYIPVEELNKVIYCGKCGLPINPHFVHKCPKKR